MGGGATASVPRTCRQRACTRRVASRRADWLTSRDDRLSALIAAIGEARDHSAFTELFQELAPQVKRLLLRRGASWALAEDLTQETMLSVWRNAGAFDRRRASVSTWVCTIARNKQLDLLRGVRRRGEAAWEPPAQESAAPPDGEEIVHSKQSAEILHRAIGTLPRGQERVVKQAFGEAKTHREIATELALPLGTVKSRLRLALAHLRTSLPMAELR
jgi:RNA polymerase sigma-70 factor, ECF subfamily